MMWSSRRDDRSERALLDQAKAQAEDNTRVEAQKATLDQKQVDYDKVWGGPENGSATSFEVDHAKLDVTIADLSLKLAVVEHAQDVRKYDEAKIHVDEALIRSPISGVVEQTLVKAGESVEQQTKVIRLSASTRCGSRCRCHWKPPARLKREMKLK